MKRQRFKTFGDLRNIPFDELSEKEKEALSRFPKYIIIRTGDKYFQGGRTGSMIYEITDTEDCSLPTIRRELNAILLRNPFIYIKELNLALEKAKNNFPKYTFEIIGETKIGRPIYRITHFDNRLKPLEISSINDLSRVKEPKDPFGIKYGKYVALDRARYIFKNYLIEVYEEDKDLNNIKNIRCKVTYPNNKYNLQPRTKLLDPLSRGEDPFYSELTILETLELARVLNKNVEITVTDKLQGSKRICEVKGTNMLTGENRNKVRDT